MDEMDRKILTALQSAGRISNTALAHQVHLSDSPCLRRVRALEASGVIQGYAALLDAGALGFQTDVFVHVALSRQDQTDLDAFEAAVGRVREVLECYLMTGEFDYLLRVVVRDPGDFERVHRDHLTRLPGVSRVQSSFALRVVKRTHELPLEG